MTRRVRPCFRRGAKADVLGVGIDILSLEEAAERVLHFVAEGGPHYVCACNVHTVMIAQSDAAYRRIANRADLAVPDGMPLVWAARRMGFAPHGRVYGPDLMLAVCERGRPRDCAHFFYGGAPGVPERLAEVLCGRFPGLRVAGAFSPPYRDLTPAEDAEVVRRINTSGADIVWVGLGAPKQERWMARHLGRIRAPVMVGVGAAFDFHTGGVRQAPAWMQAHGLEWLFRFAQEPRRLWRRYVVNNPLFLLCFGLRYLGLTRR